MITALIGLGGVVLGVVATLLSPALAERRQVRNEARRWRRDQLASAYQQALRHLLRASNRRSEFEGGRGGAVLRRQHQREWFDDLVEAQVWLRMVTRYCDDTQLERISRIADQLDLHVNYLVFGQRFDQKDFSIWEVLRKLVAEVAECARVDSGGASTSSSRRETPAANTAGGQTDVTMASDLLASGQAPSGQADLATDGGERDAVPSDDEPERACPICGSRHAAGFHGTGPIMSD